MLAMHRTMAVAAKSRGTKPYDVPAPTAYRTMR
jgi:hypothetical protein